MFKVSAFIFVYNHYYGVLADTVSHEDQIKGLWTKDCVDNFLRTTFEGGRHAKRVAQLGQNVC